MTIPIHMIAGPLPMIRSMALFGLLIFERSNGLARIWAISRIVGNSANERIALECNRWILGLCPICLAGLRVFAITLGMLWGCSGGIAPRVSNRYRAEANSLNQLIKSSKPASSRAGLPCTAAMSHSGKLYSKRALKLPKPKPAQWNQISPHLVEFRQNLK